MNSGKRADAGEQRRVFWLGWKASAGGLLFLWWLLGKSIYPRRDNPLDAAASSTAGAKTMTEGMRQHRAFVLTCLLAIAKRRTAQEVKGE